MKINTQKTPAVRPKKISGGKKPRVANPGPRAILVPVDFSTAATETIAHAAALAKATAGRVTLLHVMAPVRTAPALGELAGSIVTDDFVDPKIVTRRLQALARRSIPAAVRGELFLGEGDAGRVIATAAHDLAIDLIVLATRAHTDLERLLLGSTAEFVVRHSPCPVLAVPPRGSRKAKVRSVAAGRIRTVLVPVDLFEPSRHALRYAVALADRLTAKLTLLHVMPPLTTPRRRPLVVSRENVEAGEGARAQLVQLAASEMRGRGPVALQVLVGDAAEQIVESAARSGTNLIVVGTHGRGALGRFLLGSTAENIVRHAPCPVLVVRQPAPRPRRSSTAKLFFPVAPFLP